MRTLWAGIRESDVLCHSHVAHDIVLRMRESEVFRISERLVIRALTRNGVVHGFGLAIVQTSDPDATFDLERHRQYHWLVEGWMMERGIGPRESILMFDDDLDRVPDAPEAWK